MKRLLSLILLTGILISCWASEDVLIDEESVKTDFFIETTLWSEFLRSSSLEKVWRVSSSQDISLTSNTNGRVTDVLVKVWDNVSAGQVIARLEDNVWNISIRLQQANNSIDRAQINYDSTLLSLDKQIFDANRSLQNIERSLDIAKRDAQQNILQAQNTLDNVRGDQENVTTGLQLEQIDNNIEKAQLDYEIRLSTDQQQITSYSATLRRDFNTLTNYIDDIIDFSDTILWVTDENRLENRRFDQFLWVLDTRQKTESKRILRELISIRESSDFSLIDGLLKKGDLENDAILDTIEYINTKYEISDDLLTALEQTLFNSTPSVWELSQQQIDWFQSQINWFQSQSQNTYGAFISFGSSVQTFLATYRDTQRSLLKSIELQQKDREIQAQNLENTDRGLNNGEQNALTSLERAQIQVEDQIASLEDQLVQARENLLLAERNKTVSLRQLENAITSANIEYNSVTRDADKLSIQSPINGTISESFIDVWQEVFSWNNLFNIVSDSTPEVQVSFTESERDLVSLWQEVTVKFSDKEILWRVYSVSEVADENLNYISTIIFDSGASIIGSIVSVIIPISTSETLIPINIIETQWDDIWRVRVLSWSTIDSVRIRMWKVYGEYVELVSCAQQCEDLNIITNDISNYDENKFNIVEK